ncbi:NAD(P)-binding domain-containing protein [Cobetia sp. 14N.309.X.WAT.E.A4]|uniref:NAD(P)-dependent oxidoreductase n=1 Tax=Cobetia sp. 14N.309.X.WAT.E.A4 TaxID=2998323 RepID=UPI0025B1CCDF|nr:NAD(P)-dependent oxidoreductase [Cobetia sp. 14N.309.X.WAT.E.A4]MDN2657001.1 NAD(P)-binding domain-containing protein [Cobetia sp. 14N.309.X.WAT.E.A4]
MPSQAPILGVYLSESLDLDSLYGEALRQLGEDVVLQNPQEIEDPTEVAFAICWQPGEDAFTPYPNLMLAMSIAAGVDALLSHPGLSDEVQVARVRDPHQAFLMAGFAAHEVLHQEREFAVMADNATRREWQPLPMRAPEKAQVAVLGHGSMGRAVVTSLSALGFTVTVACRSEPVAPVQGVRYLTGDNAVMAAAQGADYLINILPLTPVTENVLNATLFAQLRPGAWLVQIGRGEHLVEADLDAALASGQLAGATLDVFREEPLVPNHRWWQDARLRITPHVASDSLPEVVAEQVVATARELRDGLPLTLGVDRQRGY